MNLGDNPAGHGFALRNLSLQANFLLKLILKLLEIFSQYICRISQYVIFLSNRKRKFKLLDLQGGPLPPQFPRLVGYPDLPTRKTLRVVDLLTVMIFFHRKKITACKIKDEKEGTFFYFLMVLIYCRLSTHFKKHLKT